MNCRRLIILNDTCCCWNDAAGAMVCLFSEGGKTRWDGRHRDILRSSQCGSDPPFWSLNYLPIMWQIKDVARWTGRKARAYRDAAMSQPPEIDNVFFPLRAVICATSGSTVFTESHGSSSVCCVFTLGIVNVVVDMVVLETVAMATSAYNMWRKGQH